MSLDELIDCEKLQRDLAAGLDEVFAPVEKRFDDLEKAVRQLQAWQAEHDYCEARTYDDADDGAPAPIETQQPAHEDVSAALVALLQRLDLEVPSWLRDGR